MRIHFIDYSVEEWEVYSILTLSKKDIKKASEVAALAFEEDPLWGWLIPPSLKRKKKLMASFELLIKFGLRWGVVYTTSENIEGLAVWFDSAKAKESIITYLYCGVIKFLRTLGLKNAMKLMKCNDFLAEMHNKHITEHHWSLAVLATKPEFQKQGYASMLIKNMMNKHDNLPYYLDTQKEVNVEFYKKFRFEVAEKAIVPDADVPTWSMVKKLT